MCTCVCGHALKDCKNKLWSVLIGDDVWSFILHHIAPVFLDKDRQCRNLSKAPCYSHSQIYIGIMTLFFYHAFVTLVESKNVLGCFLSQPSQIRLTTIQYDASYGLCTTRGLLLPKPDERNRNRCIILHLTIFQLHRTSHWVSFRHEKQPWNPEAKFVGSSGFQRLAQAWFKQPMDCTMGYVSLRIHLQHHWHPTPVVPQSSAESKLLRASCAIWATFAAASGSSSSWRCCHFVTVSDTAWGTRMAMTTSDNCSNVDQ